MIHLTPHDVGQLLIACLIGVGALLCAGRAGYLLRDGRARRERDAAATQLALLREASHYLWQVGREAGYRQRQQEQTQQRAQAPAQINGPAMVAEADRLLREARRREQP